MANKYRSGSGKGLKIFKTGDWDEVQRKISALGSNIERANEIALHHVTAKGERIAVLYMRSQSLSWKPLNKQYLKWKIKNKRSNKILFSSSTYFQTITRWVDGSKAGYIGVKRGIYETETKQEVANIALIMEFGSPARGIPARPLWRPTLNRLRSYIKVNKIFQKIIIEQINSTGNRGSNLGPAF